MAFFKATFHHFSFFWAQFKKCEIILLSYANCNVHQHVSHLKQKVILRRRGKKRTEEKNSLHKLFVYLIFLM